jgi:adenylate cyclase
LLFTLPAIGQNFDSLLNVWNDPVQSDSTCVNAYTNFIWEGYLYSQPDTAEVMAEALHDYAKEHHYLNSSTKGYNIQGLANWIQGDYPYALEYFHKNLVILEELGDKKGIAGELSNICIIYTN